MHPGTGYYPPNQPLAIMAYPNQQLMPQQQCHYIQTPLCPAQPKEQDLVLKRIEQATDRIAQLETTRGGKPGFGGYETICLRTNGRLAHLER